MMWFVAFCFFLQSDICSGEEKMNDMRYAPRTLTFSAPNGKGARVGVMNQQLLDFKQMSEISMRMVSSLAHGQDDLVYETLRGFGKLDWQKKDVRFAALDVNGYLAKYGQLTFKRFPRTEQKMKRLTQAMGLGFPTQPNKVFPMFCMHLSQMIRKTKVLANTSITNASKYFRTQFRDGFELSFNPIHDITFDLWEGLIFNHFGSASRAQVFNGRLLTPTDWGPVDDVYDDVADFVMMSDETGAQAELSEMQASLDELRRSLGPLTETMNALRLERVALRKQIANSQTVPDIDRASYNVDEVLLSNEDRMEQITRELEEVAQEIADKYRSISELRAEIDKLAGLTEQDETVLEQAAQEAEEVLTGDPMAVHAATSETMLDTLLETGLEEGSAPTAGETAMSFLGEAVEMAGAILALGFPVYSILSKIEYPLSVHGYLMNDSNETLSCQSSVAFDHSPAKFLRGINTTVHPRERVSFMNYNETTNKWDYPDLFSTVHVAPYTVFGDVRYLQSGYVQSVMDCTTSGPTGGSFIIGAANHFSHKDLVLPKFRGTYSCAQGFLCEAPNYDNEGAVVINFSFYPKHGLVQSWPPARPKMPTKPVKTHSPTTPPTEPSDLPTPVLPSTCTHQGRTCRGRNFASDCCDLGLPNLVNTPMQMDGLKSNENISVVTGRPCPVNSTDNDWCMCLLIKI